MKLNFFTTLILSLVFFSVHAQERTYNVINQSWTAKNATIKTFRNGDPIPFAKDTAAFNKASRENKPAWCHVNYDPKNEATYGILYNHYVLTDPRGFAPEGWRVPTLSDFEHLRFYHGGNDQAGARLVTNNGNCGFAAVHAGTEQGNFGESACFWTSDSDHDNFWFFYIEKGGAHFSKHSFEPGSGISVRFVQEIKIINEPAKTVKIGNQEWQAGNLAVTKFRNGDQLKLCSSQKEWVAAAKSKTPAYCYLDFNSANGEKYGVIYNYYAVMDPRNISPKNYHIATEQDWTDLTNAVKSGSAFDAGKKLKEPNLWMSKNYCSAQQHVASGFKAIPSGICYGDGVFTYFGKFAGYWIGGRALTETPKVLILTAGYDHFQIEEKESLKEAGYSIRCLMDSEEYTRKNKIYKTLKSGSYTVMDENLDVGVYRNGDAIPQAKSMDEWLKFEAENKGAWCYVNFDAYTSEKNGRLYNVFALNDSRKVAPEGWRIPVKKELEEICNDKNVVKSLFSRSGNSIGMEKKFEPESRWWTINPDKPQRMNFVTVRGEESASFGFTTSTRQGFFIICIKEN
jgi:uncharacterized protein (TIGR02145 family)